MPGIDPAVIVHKLNVSPSFSPVRQKKRVFAPERDRAAAEEVQKLREANFIREVYYPDWLANVVMVKKSNGNWRMVQPDQAGGNGSRENVVCDKPRAFLLQSDAVRTEECRGHVPAIDEQNRGIEVNPEKVEAIMGLSPPRTVKEVQSLTGKIAALNRFVSRATDKCLPFFKTLRRSFEWTDECQKAFEELKAYLSAPPLLSPSTPGEELFLYLAVSPAAVSAALIREEGKMQKPVYFVSRALRGAEERYPRMEKIAFALLTAARKLKPYFQAHTIIVLTDQPLRRAMNNPETSGRMALWAIELTGARKAAVYSDSQVVASQVNGNYDCRNERMKGYLEKVKELASNFQFTIAQVPREENQEADRLAKAASAEPMAAPEQVLSFVQYSSLLDNVRVQELSTQDDWTAPIVAYLKDGRLPDSRQDARKLKVKAARFVLIKGILYKRGFSRPYLRCLGHDEADYVMREVHEGICGNHSGSRTTARTPTGETPFQLAFGAEALIPAEVGLTSYRVESYDESKNNEALRLELDLVDEVRAAAEQRLARYQDMMAKHYNSKVRHRDFKSWLLLMFPFDNLVC
ncbi:uncharacterized protein LOC142620551 [Castanea sativa]|uniref:uncharacterized protein LOC142620551 n=1 Tax=Castanea sativa TaxID=21020 RepID=UPI003F652968